LLFFFDWLLGAGVHRYWSLLVSIVMLMGNVAVRATEEPRTALELLGRTVDAGESSKFSFIKDNGFEASYLDAPLWVAHGSQPGPTLCISAAIHGDEINGVEIARRVFAATDPSRLSGTLIVLPAINADGFRTGRRYLSDRRDLNRAFPGKSDGSIAAIIANAVFNNVITSCDALVDLHTASFHRSNLPQIRVDISHQPSFELARHFGVGIIIDGRGPSGSLRREAVDAGVPAIIYEAGEPLRFQEQEIARGERGVANVMEFLGMVPGVQEEIPLSQVFKRSSWVRVPPGQGGFFFPAAELGTEVAPGTRLGHVVDPLTDAYHEIVAPFSGQIIGMAVPQVVLSGYALFHIGQSMVEVTRKREDE
jgi:predicted deacylase